MSTAALVAGVSTGGVFVLLVACVVIAYCAYTCKHPHAVSTSPVKRLKKDTKRNKQRASQLNAEMKKERSEGCCCCYNGVLFNKEQTTASLDPPCAIRLIDPSSTEITITWNKPSIESIATTVDAYVIYKRLSYNVANWSKVGKVKSDVFSYRIKELLPETSYVFGVASLNSRGRSNIVETKPKITFKGDPVIPDCPTNLVATNKTGDRLTLRWKPPRDTGNARIITYHVMMKVGNKDNTWKDLATLEAFDRYMEYKVMDLSPKTPYHFRIAAENTVGKGPYIEMSSTVSLEKQAVPPEKPVGPLEYSEITHNSVTLTWKAPKYDGGMKITGYAIEKLQLSESKTPLWQLTGACKSSATRFTAAKLKEDVDLRFKVVAMNHVGRGQPLVGAKVRTKLHEIPLSQRSASRMYSRGSTRRSGNRDVRVSYSGSSARRSGGTEDTTKTIHDHGLQSLSSSRVQIDMDVSIPIASPKNYVRDITEGVRRKEERTKAIKSTKTSANDVTINMEVGVFNNSHSIPVTERVNNKSTHSVLNQTVSPFDFTSSTDAKTLASSSTTKGSRKRKATNTPAINNANVAFSHKRLT